QKATIDFHNLKAQIPQIIEFEGGADIAVQKKEGKYTHCFVVTVNNEKDLATYSEHPVHKAFSKSVDPLLAEVMVVDYWTE
ncbi:MAG TPA: Dabb family protein, partial [Segetibacter sp.]|nr:Dabb family protein [Segetibacter sp.]